MNQNGQLVKEVIKQTKQNFHTLLSFLSQPLPPPIPAFIPPLHICLLTITSIYFLSIILTPYIFSFSENKNENKPVDIHPSLLTKNLSSSDLRTLAPIQWKTFPLLSKTQTSHNSTLYRFALPTSKSQLNLPPGRHISAQSVINDVKTIRPYTPCSSPYAQGYFELLIRRYEYGKMSRYLYDFEIGEGLECRGPVGRFKYKVNMCKRIGLIAGGTGITPCLQLIRSVLEKEEDANGKSSEDKESSNGFKDVTNFTLVYQNRNFEDVLLKDTLDKLTSDYPGRLTVLYYLSQSIDTKQQPGMHTGYITKDVVADNLHIDQCGMVGLCGPTGFCDSMKGLLVEFGGHLSENVEKKRKGSIYVW